MFPKHLSVVTEDADHQLLLAHDVFTPDECEGWIAFCEGLGLVSTRPPGGRPEPGNAYRDNYRVQVHDPDIAEALWSSGLGNAIAAKLPAGGAGGTDGTPSSAVGTGMAETVQS